MSNVSFGKMTPQAFETTKCRLIGMAMGAKLPGKGQEQAITYFNEEIDSFNKAIDDPHYLFDINPDFVNDMGKSKDGHTDNKAYLMYKVGKGNDKYAYLGKFDSLNDGYRHSNSINDIIGICKRIIADKIWHADESQKTEDAKKETDKLLALEV